MQNLKKGELYKQAADKGYAVGQRNLGVLYRNGEGVDHTRGRGII